MTVNQELSQHTHKAPQNKNGGLSPHFSFNPRNDPYGLSPIATYDDGYTGPI
jgi:hypothetical protein